MKRSEMTELVMKAHTEGVFVEDVFEEAYQKGRVDAVNEYYNNVFIPALEQFANRMKELAEQIKGQKND